MKLGQSEDNSAEVLNDPSWALCPKRILYPHVRRSLFADGIFSREWPFKLESRRTEGDYWEVNDDELIRQVSDHLRGYKWTADHVLSIDFASSLYRALVNGSKFLGVTQVENAETPEHPIRSVVTLSKSVVFRLAFGPFLGPTGRALHGTGEVVGEHKKRLWTILTEHRACPLTYATYQSGPKETDPEKYVFFGRPFVVDQVDGNVIKVNLSHRFFPILLDESGKVKLRHWSIPHPVALGTLLSIGRHRLARGKGPTKRKKGKIEGYPQTPVSVRGRTYSP